MRYCLLIALTSLLSAAIGPETTAVIINGDHPVSVSIAETWMRLRRIPAEHAVTLQGIPDGHRMALADFQRQILDPIEATLRERGLAEHISLIAYAPGFPTAISFPEAEKRQRWQNSPGSLTGMTLLAPLFAESSLRYTAFRANPYAEIPQVPGAELDAAAFEDPRCRDAIQAMTDKRLVDAHAQLTLLAKDQPAPSVWYNLACLDALQGNVEAAEVSLAQAVDAGWWDTQHTQGDDDLTSLRERPAWPGLLTRIAANAQTIRPSTSIPFSQIPGLNGSVPGRLAMLLAPLGERGLDAAEAEAMLTSSVQADGSQPTGNVYFMISADAARTGSRRWAFQAAAQALNDLDVHAEVLNGVLPPTSANVIGAMIGIADFDWNTSGATILPGAWCDHLTSFGGALQPGAGQTPLSAFLRAGAAGAGGAVAEPLNLAAKFPSAFVHVHRVRGLSLVEAVHRTMSCPYQYLAVGDPLSRPWLPNDAP